MTITDFLQLVHKMRSAQSDFFKFKTKRDLQLSMRLEKEVDEALKQLNKQDTPDFKQLSIDHFL
jgi:hypothetical protein